MRCVWGAAIVLVLVAESAAAHGMKLFAVAEGRELKGSVYFVGGADAVGVEVRLLTAAGRELGRTTTDDQGAFVLPLTEHCDLELVAQTADGHRADYKIPQSELPSPAGMAAPASADADAVEQAELESLRRRLREQDRQVRMRDILGGIGYIVGILGIIAYLKAGRRARA